MICYIISVGNGQSWLFLVIIYTVVTISFNPILYTVSEGELVDLNIELAGEAQVNVAVMFQTRSVTATGMY